MEEASEIHCNSQKHCASVTWSHVFDASCKLTSYCQCCSGYHFKVNVCFINDYSPWSMVLVRKNGFIHMCNSIIHNCLLVSCILCNLSDTLSNTFLFCKVPSDSPHQPLQRQVCIIICKCITNLMVKALSTYEVTLFTPMIKMLKDVTKMSL